jgi:hypothetical protein
VAVVTGVLLDHVGEQLAQRDRVALAILADEAEIMVAGELLGEGDFLAPRCPRFFDHGRVGDGTVEVGIGVGLGLVAIGHVLPSEPDAEPVAFHLGHVPDQAKQ